MSPLASWCLLGALIAVVFAVVWLLSGEDEDSFYEAEDESWLNEDE